MTAAAGDDQGGFGLNVLTGGALGALVGLLIGLSASPVVASAAAAILALLVTFFGFGGTAGGLRVTVSGARVLGFGVAMAAALVGGIALRSHGMLGPRIDARAARYLAAGLPADRARDLAVYEHLGLLTGHLAGVAAPEATPATSPYAFSDRGGADPNCAALDPRYLPDPAARLDAMAQSAEPWRTIGRAGQALPAGERAGFATAAFRLRCGGDEGRGR